MTKRYLLDSNVFFIDYKAIEKLSQNGENEVYVCSTTLEELDSHKNDQGIDGYNVRKSIRWMDNNSDKFKFVVSDHFNGINDDKIISSAKENNCILISNDLNVRLKCKALGIECEGYKDIEKIELGELRKGKHIIKNNHKLLADCYEGKANKLDGMYEHDFVLFYDNEELKDIMQVKNGKIIKAKLNDKGFSGCELKNLEQKLATTLLYDTNLELITFTGCFGTAKTFMMLGVGLEHIAKGNYDKMYIVKAPMAIDKSVMVGYKSGNFAEKMELPLASISSNLSNMKNKTGDKFTRMYGGYRMLEDLINSNTVEIISLEDILGMSLSPKSILLIEEAEILDSKLMRAVISRVGANSVVYANGDLKQNAQNNLLAEDTGLFKLINAFNGYDKYAHLTLESVIRSGFVAELSKRWVD